MNRLSILILGSILMPSQFIAQNVFRSVQDGDWDDASTWFAGAGTGGIEGINYPSSTDSVYVLHNIDITATNSGNDFLFEGYLNVAAGVKLQCEEGDSNDGLVFDNNAVVELFGTIYAAKAGDLPSTANPGAVEFTVLGNARFTAYTGSFLFVADDWEIEENAVIYIEDDVCIRVDDDVNFDGTGWTMCGDGDISIGGNGAASTVNFGGGSSNAQICTGASIIRNTTGTDCSTGTTLTTGTGASGAAPTAVDDKITTEINQAVIIQVLTLGTADSDPASDTLQIQKIGSNAAIDDNLSAEGGIISIQDNDTPADFTDDFVLYAPPAGFVGVDTFRYVILDEDGLTDTAEVLITVFECGNSYVDLIGVGANGATTATLTFTDTTNIDSIRLDLVYKNGLPTFATFVSSAGETNSGTQIDAINIAGGDDGVYRTTIGSASSVTVTHDNAGGVRSFLAYIYRRGVISAITSIADDQVVYLFNNSFSFTQEIPSGATPRDIRIQMPISELNEDSRSALLEVTAGPVFGSLETFTQDLGNSLKIFTLMLKDVPGDVSELDVVVTSKTGGAGDSFITAGISFGIQCSGESIEAVPDNASTEENTPVTIDILDNDLQGNGSIDTSRITNIGVLDPQNGTVTINAFGQAVYTPDPGFTGVDYFQYEVCDTLQLCDITTVTVTVTCAGGQFSEVAEALGLDLGGGKPEGGLSWADLNRDGMMDVIVNTADGTNNTRIFFAEKNSGVLSYSDVTATNASGLLDNSQDRSVVIGDLNNDGYPDFVRNDFGGSGIEIWFNRGPGSTPAYSFGNNSQDENISINTFNTSNNSGDGFNSEGIVLADWNQDGWLDLIVENDEDGIEILENDKDGTFSEVAHATSGFTASSTLANRGDFATAIDFDNDGFVDYMARRNGEADLYQFNAATGQFDVVASPNLAANTNKGAITFCDVDNDADFDIIWARQTDDNNTSIYLQNADGTFSFGTNLVNDNGIEECDCADVDNDGDNDIFLGDDGGTSYLFKNNTVKGGALSFAQDNDCIDPSADVETSEFVDFDNDGDMDLYMNINGGDNQLWQNGQDDKNFVKVAPRINLGNGKYRSAIGANVMLIENCFDTCQIRDVSGGRGHGSQKPEVVHFGLPNGPNKSYKIVVFFVDKDGTRDTVIKSVTPSKLKNQRIVIYNTDSDYDLCLDADQDGIPNNIDIDDDNDGILDVDESRGANDPSGDEDGDGIENWQDVSDGGGAGDGSVTNYTDADGNGVADIHDFDGDGVPNHYDLDSDNDGVPDIIEAGGVDLDNDGRVSGTLDGAFVDTDGDGWSNVFDPTNLGTPLTDSDTDGDGLEDRIDLDSDNDGIQDIVEAGGLDYNKDGVDNGTDTDGDGLNDRYDLDNDGTPLTDGDADQDGFKNRVDLDSDNDGISDLIETRGEDANFDGLVDGVFADTDNDGWSNTYDSDNGGASLSVEDEDEDGYPNRIDIDSDKDGILDIIESQPTGTLIIPSGTDSDNDGIDDNFDPDSGNTLTNPENTDGTDNPDYLDDDSDNDGDSDLLEGWDTDNDGIGNTLLVNLDSDEDGLDDGFDTIVQTIGNGKTTNVTDNGKDADSYPNEDRPDTDERDWREDKDNDNDGIIDSIDLDDDNDGVLDTDEGSGSNNPSGDEDGDGILNYEDVTDDGNGGDGSTTDYTDTNGDGIPDVFDTDGDGVPNLFDLDSDNDGIPDLVEAGGEDTDGNGLVDDIDTDGILDNDTDNNGLDDRYDAGNGGNAIANPDSDNDGISDVLDLDSDNDGIPDVVEAGGTDENGDGIADNFSDADGDGFNDDVDGDPNQDGTSDNSANALTVTGNDGNNDGVPDSYPNDDNDGDGNRNQVDLDSDNDGIPDVVEQGGTDENGDGRADDYVDADGDGFNDVLDTDLDNDGTVDNAGNSLLITGTDGNGDGAPDTKPNGDFDGDDVYNFLDLDADNDGIMDVVEAGGSDTDRDGIEDAFADVDGDGFNDNVDGDTDNSLAAGVDTDGGQQANATTLTAADGNADGAPDDYPNDDFDDDGNLNFLDIDADNDGIVDNTEGQSTTGYIAPANADADGDGIDDAYDDDDANFGGAGAVGYLLSDIDGTENPDYLDLDTDADGINDAVEGHDTNGDGVVDGSDTPVANTGLSGGTTDTDGDGLLDGFDNNTASTDPTNSGLEGEDHPNFSNPISDERDWRELPDADNDGITDGIDIDDDNDGVLDRDEAPCETPTIRFLSTPEAYWTLDNNTNDVSGNGNNERSDGNAPGFSTDAIQGTHSANFNGTSNQIRYSQDGGFMEGTYTDVSFSAWIKPTAAGLTGNRVIYEEGGGTNGLILWLDDGLLTYTGRSGGAGSETSVAVDASLTLTDDGLWHHVAGIFEDGEMTVFIDGISFSTTAGFASIPTHTSDGGLGGPHGGSPNGVSGNFAGLMDAARYSTSEAWSEARVGYEAQRFCDSDLDGIADHLDLDSDNDGIPDILEAGGTDANNDGRVDGFADGDNDGWATTFDNVGEGGTPLTDGDQDDDGFKNRLDLDADDDGLADIIEAGGADTDNDGRADNPADGDNDGWANLFDGDNGGTVLPVPDTDGDGTLPNYLDLDSDNDGIIDNIEWQTTADFMVPSSVDANSNGWDDEYDDGPTPQAISDNDGAGDGADYIDLNSDTDGQPDWLERADDDEDGDALLDLIAIADAYEAANGNPNHYVSSDDADSDDIPDFLEDADSDGTPNFLDPDNGTFYRDTDNDGIVDLYDATQNGNNRDNVNQLGDIDNGGDYDFRDGTNDVTLPIELINFTATKVGKYVQLDWSTATEINNDYFTIERSTDGENFEELLTEKGAGNSSSRREYRRYDESPEIGYNYYRLSQTDFNGESESFKIEVVNFDGGFISKNSSLQKVKVYPNPTDGSQLFMEIDQPEPGTYQVELLSAQGKLLEQYQFNVEDGTLYYEQEMIRRLNLAKGVYYLRLQIEGKTETFKFIVL